MCCSLCNDSHFLFKPTDKNLGIVCIARDSYVQFCRDSLSKMNARRLSREEFDLVLLGCHRRLEFDLLPQCSVRVRKHLSPLLEAD